MKRITGILAITLIIAASSIVDAHASRESVVADASGAEVVSVLAKSGANLNNPETAAAASGLVSAYSDVFGTYYDMGRDVCTASKFVKLDDADKHIILAHNKMQVAQQVLGVVDVTRAAAVFMAGCENK